MKKNYIARRRGTSVAAAALSFALVAPLAQPVAAPQLAAAAFAEENADAVPADSSKAIYSPGQASQKGTISGSVKEIVEAGIGFGNVQDSGKPIAGVKVYAQWYEGASTQHSSPVYYTESDENGNFTINMAPYVDANGVTREFRADGSTGVAGQTDTGRDESREKIRIWTELPEDKVDQYRLVYQPAAGIFPGIGSVTTPTTQGDNKWGGNKITNVAIQYAQKDKLPQHLPKNQWSENAGRNNNHGVYQGRAFWNLDVLQGALNHNSVSAFGGKDIAAPGLKVVGSYLSDEAVTKIHEYAKNNFAGKTLRGKGWTAADEQGLQKWINEQVAADPQGWIAETVTTTTGADGTFHLYWKGLYGNSYTGTGGGINPPAEKLHKLAGSWDEGSWANGNSQSKHVNMHWSYVSVYDKDGNPLPDNIGVLYPWALGQWAGPGFGANLNAGGNAQLFGGDGVKILDGDDVYSGWNVALVPQALKFDVVEKNTTDNWATIGDTVQTDTSGLPITEDLNYYVEWFDKDGKSVKRCDLFKVDDATKIPSCELAVPADAQTGDTFTARLKVTEGEPADDDLVLAMDAFAVTRAYLAYDEKPAVKGEEATSAPKFDNPATEDEETKPENAVFELGKLPEGVKSDQVEVDPKTGVVTFKPTAEQVGKTFTFPVVMRDEDLQVPVYDENGAPVLDDQGNQKTQGRVVARGEAPFKVAAAKDADKYDPKGQDQSVKVGETPDPKKNIENADDLPEGTKYEYKETPDTKTPGEKKVTVVVTYPDGSKDEVETTVTVTEDPKPETKDNEKYDPKGQDQSVKVGETPDPKKNIENVGDLPEGTKYEYKETPDTKTPGEKKVTVVVTYPDGSKDEVETTVTVTEDPKPETKDNEKYDPKGQDQSVKVGETPDPKKNIENVGDLPEGTKYEYKETPDTKTPGEKKVTVVVTYPDGSKDEVETTVTVTEDPKPETKDNEKYDPKGQDQVVKTGDTPDPKKNIENAGDLPEDTKYEYEGGTPDTSKEGTQDVTVVVTYPDGSTDEVTTTVTVKDNPSQADLNDPKGQDQVVKTGDTPDPKKNIENADDLPDGTKFEYEGGTPDTSKPGEYDVTVIVTYPDGSTDKVDTKVIVGTDAERFVPEYDKVTDVPVDGDKDTNDPFGKKAPVKDVVVTPTEGSDADKWTFTPQDNGVINAKAPSMKDVKDKIETKLPEIKSTEAGKKWDKFVEELTPFARPSVDVDFEYNDGSKNSATAGFDLVGKDGKSLLDPDGDFDGDGISNKDEIEKGTNPADEGSNPDTEAPTVDPVKPGDKKITGKDNRPNSDITVTFPDGTEKKVTTDKDGNWSVDVPEGTELNHGDKIKVTDEAGNGTDVEVKDTDKPVINEIKPGDKVISGKGDRPGEDIFVTIPGVKNPIKTTTDKDGNWKVDVPAGIELKPGDEVKVADGAGHEATAKVGIDTGKCVASAVGFGLPLIALLPIGLATQLEIPGLSDFAAQANAQIQNANTQIQQQLGIFNPQLATQVDAINAKLGQYGTDLATVAGGLALIAAGILAGTIIYDNCSPNGGGSSVKDLELKGSSGKTYAGSSKEEQKKPTTTPKQK